jgi:hypothetical protein
VTLWLNSTLGIFSLVAARVDTEGAWIEMKKPILKSIMVLDPHAMKSEQRAKLVSACRRGCQVGAVEKPLSGMDPPYLS